MLTKRGKGGFDFNHVHRYLRPDLRVSSFYCRWSSHIPWNSTVAICATSSEGCAAKCSLSSLGLEGQFRPSEAGFLSLPVVIKSLYLIYLITVIMMEVIDSNVTLARRWATLSILRVIIPFHPHICIMGGGCDYLAQCTETRNSIWVSTYLAWTSLDWVQNLGLNWTWMSLFPETTHLFIYSLNCVLINLFLPSFIRGVEPKAFRMIFQPSINLAYVPSCLLIFFFLNFETEFQ